jgi:hypothetical protein
MAYEAPTAAELKARHPAFNSVLDATVTAALTEAARMVDESWTEGDFKAARMYYAAHLMVLDGLGDSKEAKISGLVLSGLTSIKIANLSVGFGKAKDGKSKTLPTLMTTSYGQRFVDLLRLNKPAVVVVNGVP